MILEWFNAREASQAGTALADKLAHSAARIHNAADTDSEKALREIVGRAGVEVRALRLNFFKRAKLTNSFKWRLMEKGVAPPVADLIAKSLMMSLSALPGSVEDHPVVANEELPNHLTAHQLLHQGNKYFAARDYHRALETYQQLIAQHPRHAIGLANIGAALWNLGHYEEARQHLWELAASDEATAESLCLLGDMLRSTGRLNQSEEVLRRALKMKPNYLTAQLSLGQTLVLLGDLKSAKSKLRKVIKSAPRTAEAYLGLGQAAAMEGRFDEAEATLRKALEIKPRLAAAWAQLAGLRKMGASDTAWLEGAQASLTGECTPIERATVCFALGKYWDDVGVYEKAFDSYREANELLKPLAEPYVRSDREALVGDLMRVYTKPALAAAQTPSSESAQPVFIVGMPRSGTSLVDQIVSSHPSVRSAGELSFWHASFLQREDEARQRMLEVHDRKRLAEEYLRVLNSKTGDALHIVDKATINADLLGLIHSVFPRARIICLRRDAIDTCLSCYFHQLPLAFNYTLDLANLAHAYKQHRRLMAHWHAVLPPGAILDVPYSDLVADQETWTRKVLEFIGLPWDPRCLNFHETERAVATASYWQVRQKVYKTSVERWRNYEKFIGPLKSLRNA